MDARQRADLDRYLTRSDEHLLGEEDPRENLIGQIVHGGWPDAPELAPHSWLQSLIQWAEEIGPQIHMEDPASFWEMLGEIRTLRSNLQALATWPDAPTHAAQPANLNRNR